MLGEAGAQNLERMLDLHLMETLIE